MGTLHAVRAANAATSSSGAVDALRGDNTDPTAVIARVRVLLCGLCH